jgi:hypothetical protein
MLDNNYAEVEQQLFETLNRLMQATEPGPKRTLVAHLRLLLIEADRILEESSSS